jgi:hypothetical protein
LSAMRGFLAESRGVVLTAHALARDLATAQAVETLREVDVRSIVLKGPAIARWLYEDGAPRPYSDSDLLVSPARLGPAAGALESIGYSLVLDDRLAPSGDAHHLMWRRDRDGAKLELHWRLPGVRASTAVAWRRLSAETDRALLAGSEVEFLALPARALHLALHATQDAPERLKPLEDLRRGLRVADGTCWRAAAALAAVLSAQDAFAAGLRAIPEGAVVAAELGLPAARRASVVDMRASGASVRAVNFQRLLSERGPIGTARALGRVVIPSVAFMRWRYAEAERGPASLAAAYVQRWASLWRDLVPVLRSIVRVNARSRR